MAQDLASTPKLRSSMPVSNDSLLVTGDDFGESSRVNEAVERDFEAGFLTQASLMVAGPAVGEALRIARRHPVLAVGLHLAVCDSAGLTAGRHLMRNGLLDRSPTRAGLRYAFDPRLRAELQREIDAQFDRFIEIDPGGRHFDSHMHLHLHPMVWRFAADAARRCGFRAYRSVRENTMGVYEFIFHALSCRAQKGSSRLEFQTTDSTRGLRVTFGMTPDVVSSWLRGPLRSGITEWIYHPGKEPYAWDPRLAAEHLATAKITPTSWKRLLGSTLMA